MSTFQLGKSNIEKLTGKVVISQPADGGVKRRVATLKVTTKVVSRSEFNRLTESTENDKELVKELVLDIVSGDNSTETAPYTPDMMDDIFEYEWQFNPIFEFVMASNSERMGGLIKAKN